jgi:hypothetical protein
MPENYSAQPLIAVGARSDAVAYVATEDGYVVQVRNASTGTVRFTSRPWEPPAPLETDGLLGPSLQLPSVATTVQDGRGYVVLWAHGEVGGDTLDKGKQSVRLLVFPADASGSAVAPSREIDIPVDVQALGEDHLRVADFGTGLEVHWETQNTDKKAVAVDVTNGTLDHCADACAKGVGRIRTDQGWVVSDYSHDSVSMPGAWDIHDAAPPGAEDPKDTANGEFVAVNGGHLCTRWQAGSGSVTHPLTALHSATTGKLETSVVCDRPDGSDAVASPDGRFVTAGSVGTSVPSSPDWPERAGSSAWSELPTGPTTPLSSGTTSSCSARSSRPSSVTRSPTSSSTRSAARPAPPASSSSQHTADWWHTATSPPTNPSSPTPTTFSCTASHF